MAAENNQNDTMAELLKAMKLMQKAKEKNIDLSASNESLLLEKLAKVKEEKKLIEGGGGSHSSRSCFYMVRWAVYCLLWIVGIAYLVALNHRETLCQTLDD